MFCRPLLEVAAAAVLVAAVAIVVLAFAQNFSFGGFWRLVVLAGSVLLLADPFMGLLGTEMNEVSGISWTMCLVLFETVAFSVLVAAACEGHAHISAWVVAGRTLKAACMLVGANVAVLLSGADFNLLVTALIVAFLVVLVFTYVYPLKRGMRPDSEAENGEASAKRLRQERIELVAVEFGLSALETEVFGYLIQGRGEGYISEQLFISPSTVKTHRKHIYRKIGVSSREELLDFALRRQLVL